MDQFGFEQLAAWLAHRVSLPVGPLFCVIDGPTRGRRWAATAARAELRQLAAEAGIRRRFAPHQLRHAHAVELAREGVTVNIIQRQLGHTDLGTTSTYLQGIDPQRSSTPSDRDASPPSQRPRASPSERPAARTKASGHYRSHYSIDVISDRSSSDDLVTGRATERQSRWSLNLRCRCPAGPQAPEPRNACDPPSAIPSRSHRSPWPAGTATC